MGCASMILAVLFRSKFTKLENLSKTELKANVYNKTFVVFDPYSEQRKIIHSYLPLWALIAGFASFAASLASFVLLGMGFGLSIFATLAGLNLIIMDDAFDVYKNSNLFANAISKKGSLGVGDLKVFSILRMCTWRLSYYYLGVAALLIFASATLPYILNQVILVFAILLGEIIQLSSVAGFANWQFGVLLFSIFVVLSETLIIKIKSRIFKI